MNTKLIGIAFVVIVLVVAAALVLKTKDTSKTNTAATNPTPTTQQAVEVKPNITNVTVTANGYEPKEITIKAGEKVTWTNQNETKVTVNSDSHPTHLLWPFLNLGTFENGETVSTVFEKAGTYTYHNHLSPSQTGTVIVE